MIDMSQLWPAHFQYYYMHCMYVLVIVIQGICALFWTCTFNEHGTWQRLGVEEGGWLKVTDNIHPSISPSITTRYINLCLSKDSQSISIMGAAQRLHQRAQTDANRIALLGP